MSVDIPAAFIIIPGCAALSCKSPGKGRRAAIGAEAAILLSLLAVRSSASFQLIRHSLPDEKILQLLQNIREAMREDGILLQVDHVIPPGNTSSSSKFADLYMMVFTPSHERTEDEYRALYEKAGFNLTGVLHMPSESSILEVHRK